MLLTPENYSNWVSKMDKNVEAHIAEINRAYEASLEDNGDLDWVE